MHHLGGWIIYVAWGFQSGGSKGCGSFAPSFMTNVAGNPFRFRLVVVSKFVRVFRLFAIMAFIGEEISVVHFRYNSIGIHPLSPFTANGYIVYQRYLHY